MRIHVSVQRNHLFGKTNTQKIVGKVKNLRLEENLSFVYLCICVSGQRNHSLCPEQQVINWVWIDYMEHHLKDEWSRKWELDLFYANQQVWLYWLRNISDDALPEADGTKDLLKSWVSSHEGLSPLRPALFCTLKNLYCITSQWNYHVFMAPIESCWRELSNGILVDVGV